MWDKDRRVGWCDESTHLCLHGPGGDPTYSHTLGFLRNL